MKNVMFLLLTCALLFVCLVFSSCNQTKPAPDKETIAAINLKKGELIACGPPGAAFGSVLFDNTCSEKVKNDFTLGIELLHSFEYDEAEKVFAKVIAADPRCAMAYWGVAMSNYHPLWMPPTEAELAKGAKAIAAAKSIAGTSKRESQYIEAVSAFYTGWETLDHHTRCLRFEQEMEKLYADYPNDMEAAIFYALALDAAASPTDLTYANQKKAGAILQALYRDNPNHPGIAHYLIHTFDYPELAPSALAVARRYASIAPSSAHAQHMPSHIFTRLGLWNESIASNLASMASAKCYGETAGLKGHWDEELHGMDYLVYAYLQKGQDTLAKQQLAYLATIDQTSPVNYKVAYAFAAIPARYVLENKYWTEAANLTLAPATFAWKKYPWQEAIVHFTKLLGAVHTGNMALARLEYGKLNMLHDTLVAQKDAYKATEVQIQLLAGGAWIHLAEGQKDAALKEMRAAADKEDSTGKHPVTPGEVVPARELLGDMELQLHDPKQALITYQADLQNHPNRYNGLFGACEAAELLGNMPVARVYYQQLYAQTASAGSNRLDKLKRLLR